MRIRLSALVCLLASTITLTGCIAGVTYDRGPQAASFLYTQADTSSSTATGITSSYPAGSTGSSVAAVSSASLAANYLGYGVRGDGAGNIYSLGNLNTACCGFIVNVYSTANGVLTLTRSFVYAAGGTFYPQSFAVDPTGIVYVSMITGSTAALFKFAANATGAATPTSISTGINYYSPMATDSAGDLYAYNGSGQIYEYLAGFTTGTPARTLTYANIPLHISDMALDSSSNIYITGYTPASAPYISEYSSATGTTTPMRTISGSSTLLLHPVAIAVDAVGNIYEEDAATTAITPHVNHIYTFSPEESSNMQPISQFSPATLTVAPATYVGLVAY